MNDSIWAVVAGLAKAYGLTPDYVLYDMSYANVIMYGAVLPSYKSKGNKEKQEKIKADDPKNQEKVINFLNSIE